jgi:hypothetical protein
MQRINTIIDKIKELNRGADTSVIEIDLMMDYTRIIYADLLEWKNKIGFNDSVTLPQAQAEDRPRTQESAQDHMQPAPPASSFAQAPLAPVPKAEAHTPLGEEVFTGDVKTPVTAFQPEPFDIYNSGSNYSGKDIRQQIGINDKYQFISELFGNNKEAYEEVIAELNTFESQETALSWLHQNAYNQFGWNDEMETVQMFYKLLSDFFSAR